MSQMRGWKKRMGAKEKENENENEKSGKIKWQRNRQIHSTDQSRELAESAKFWRIGGKKAGPIL